MYNRVYRYNPQTMKGKALYSQLECTECLKLTNKMLEEEFLSIVSQKQKIQAQNNVRQILGSPNSPKEKARPTSDARGPTSQEKDIHIREACEMVQNNPLAFVKQVPQYKLLLDNISPSASTQRLID
jgi:hypothetical protein